jgi:uncharacterized repeat protein (TIGR01451 family)
MFKKIISNLPFSPALVSQIGLYSKKLRKEKAIRRLSLVFVILTLIIQSFAVFQPPESANAADSTDLYAKKINQLIDDVISKSITSTSTSQGFVDATSVTAVAGDQISYTLTVQNNSTETTSTNFAAPIADILEYSRLIDNGGGLLNSNTGILSWPDATIDPKMEQSRTFIVRLLDKIPATSQGTVNTKSYDCMMTNIFGETININVACPAMKTVENIISELPKVGLMPNIFFSIITLMTTAYFYLRSRQLEKEIHLIRKDIRNGTI